MRWQSPALLLRLKWINFLVFALLPLQNKSVFTSISGLMLRVLNSYKFFALKKCKSQKSEKVCLLTPPRFPIPKAKLHMSEIFFLKTRPPLIADNIFVISALKCSHSFDLKVRHKDPSGSKIQVLTVRCGKQVATEVASILSTSLNGEGTNPEIFISRLALGANRTAPW